MRHIGHLADELQARVFSDFLVARGIRNEMERESDGSWIVWIHDEDHISEAQAHLTRFSSGADSAEFANISAEADRVRKAEAEDLEKYRKRIRTSKGLFPKLGGYGVGVLTYALIIVCVIVAIFSRLGNDLGFLSYWFIRDPDLSGDGLLPEVFAGQVWRLISPIFIHFGPIHLIFNLMWVYHLGSMIEGRQSSWHLAGLVLVAAVISNFAQFFFAHSITFGGMSGVVYALAGYVWLRGHFDRASGLYLDKQSVIILLVWLVVCYTGWVGPIANTAHLSGLLVGLAWGGLSALTASRRPG